VPSVRGLIFASFVVSSIARGEPKTVATSWYAGLSGAVGTAEGGNGFTGFVVEGGYRVADAPVWLHAAVVKGSALHNPWDNASDPDGDYLELRGGVEAHGCLGVDGLCGIAGIDLGFHHETPVVDGVTMERRNAIAVERLGFDVGVGSIHARLRFTLEVGETVHGIAEGGVTLGGAYRW
jgi:hypothetical protein